MFRKPSFLERLTGSVKMGEYDEQNPEHAQEEQGHEDRDSWDDGSKESQQEGELPVDMFVTNDSIVIKTLVAGVNPDDLDIAITRDMVTIRGSREEEREAADENYQFRELYWGSFSRTIVLPEEVLIDEAEAKEKHGLLTIILPKVDKGRSTKLKVKPHAVR